jgi:hypothetical protein
MAQNPLAATIFEKKSGNSYYQAQPVLDATGNLPTQDGGASSKLNVTAAAVVKATPGRLRKVSIIVAGSTSGGFVINDAVTTTASTTTGDTQSNVIWYATYTSAAAIFAAGGVINLDWPCANGITVSAVPGSGSPQIAVSYD